MTSQPIVSRIQRLTQSITACLALHKPETVLPGASWQVAADELPKWVQESAIALRYQELLGPLAWESLPPRNPDWPAPGPIVPYRAFLAACLIKLDQHHASMGQLRTFLVEHPSLVWLLGFPLVPSRQFPWGFDADASLPTQRHFTRLLRSIPNSHCQLLLDSTIGLIQTELAGYGIRLGETISLDTKHILAWVRENNPKEYVEDRYNKEKQPKGDPDCKLGFKARNNQRKDLASADGQPPTPTKEGKPASQRKADGEYLWGYASGVVATKVADWGEFVLAEMTCPLDTSDVAYFFPLMEQVERRLGFKPSTGSLDAAFDAFYVYDYFHEAGGFAAVPWADSPQHRKSFSPDGLPLCAAGLPMPLKNTFWKQSHCLIPHQCARYACPLLFPQPSAPSCPVNHKNWAKQGCLTTLPLSPGTRIRHQLDRSSALYKQAYRQRSATERINSLATSLGIERPKLRNGHAIANLNSLLYVLLNLKALHRMRYRGDSSDSSSDF
jgi:hypothetical protein